MTPATEGLVTASGRRITWCRYGAPAGRIAIVVHGSPGSRFEGMPLAQAAADAGVTVVVPDRPGFGSTDPAPDRGFHSWDDDFVALIDHLGQDRVSLVGFSGGAGYAIAAALAHPERVERLILACGMIPGAPREALRTRIPLITALYRACRWAPWLAGAMLAGRGPFASTREANVSAWPEADQRVMTDPALKELTAQDAVGGMAQGPSATVQDLARYARHRESLEDVSVPTRIIHGSADRNVPVDVARWGAARIPGAQLTVIPDAGHLFLVTDPELLMSALAD